MKVLAVTCYTGGEEMCAMTERMLEGLQRTKCSCELVVSITAQGGVRDVGPAEYVHSVEKNVSFAYGMNSAIENGRSCNPDYVLCLNNDLEFPEKQWFRELIRTALPNRVEAPSTDRAATPTQPHSIDKVSSAIEEVSAYCWLLPFAICELLKEKYGFWLFSEEFVPCYGEDNWTSYLLTKHYGPSPVFRLIHRSWVKHNHGSTSRKTPHNRKKTFTTLRNKLLKEAKSQKLRPDLRRWINRYDRMLRGKC